MMSQDERDYYLQTMGIDRWVLRQPEVSPKKQLAQLAQEAAHCQACELYKTRKNIVFAKGNPDASLMIVGEAPGESEDNQGQPFVGRSGELLTQMLASIGLTLDDVYIVNVLKCHPIDNSKPTSEQIHSCTHFLSRQIELVQPKWILSLGATAAFALLNSKESVHELRTGEYFYKTIPVLISYHPAYLLRNSCEKKKVYQDLLRLRELYTSS